jgi:hypothetical protein
MCEGYTDSCWLARTLPQGPALSYFGFMKEKNNGPKSPSPEELEAALSERVLLLTRSVQNVSLTAFSVNGTAEVRRMARKR